MSLIDQFKDVIGTSSGNKESRAAAEKTEDPYKPQFAKTDASAMSNLVKNGSFDFQLSDKQSSNKTKDQLKQISPRSPVGRKDRVEEVKR